MFNDKTDNFRGEVLSTMDKFWNIQQLIVKLIFLFMRVSGSPTTGYNYNSQQQILLLSALRE